MNGPLRYIHGSMLRVARDEADFLWGTAIHLLDTLELLAGPLELLEAAGTGMPGGQRCYAERMPSPSPRKSFPPAGAWRSACALPGRVTASTFWTGTNHPWRVEAYAGSERVVSETAPAADPPFRCSGTYAETAAFLQAILDSRPLPGPNVAEAMAATKVVDQLA